MKKSAKKVRRVDIREAMKLAGAKGGKARARNLTKEELAEIGRKGGEASRGKPRKPYKKRKKAEAAKTPNGVNSRYMCEVLIEKRFRKDGGK